MPREYCVKGKGGSVIPRGGMVKPRKNYFPKAVAMMNTGQGVMTPDVKPVDNQQRDPYNMDKLKRALDSVQVNIPKRVQKSQASTAVEGTGSKRFIS